MGLYSKQRAEEHACMLEEFANVADNYLIYEDMDPEKKEKALKVVRKAVKNLRKGRYEKVYDREKYIDDMEKRSGGI